MVSPQHKLDFLSVEKTRQQYEQGDLILFVIDGSCALDDDDRDIFEKIKDKHHIIVINKTDLPQKQTQKTVQSWCGHRTCIINVSMVTKEGVPALERELVKAVWQEDDKGDEVFIMHMRHKKAVEISLTHMHTVRRLLQERGAIELIACDMQEAIEALRILTGEIYADDILDAIFNEFCIGK